MKVAVVGAGAAGIVAAWRASTLGASVTVFEKTSRIGTKILISGGGKCNITHDGPLEEVLRAFRPNEARFIRPACYRFPPSEIVRMLVDRGLQVYTRDDGRIFPVHQTAKDVVAILRSYLDEAGVTLLLNTPVRRLERDEGGIRAVWTTDASHEFDRVILTVGGASYPNSGTTGDGWPWAEELGHTLVPLRAALAPIELEPPPPEGWAGVALRGVVLKARQAGKEVARWQADVLFTHQGVSGPAVLGISRLVAEHMECGEVTLEVDLRPDLSFEAMGAWLLFEIASNGRRQTATLLGEILPAKLADPISTVAGIEGTTPLSQLTRKQKNRLIEVLKAWPIGRSSNVVFDRGEVVAGGVSLDEVDPQTMESRIVPGLFLAGEVLDIAGPVGGYNLQAAWATGFVAGASAARA